jgi:hypothetical protein
MCDMVAQCDQDPQPLASRVDDGITGTSTFAYDWAKRLTTTTLPSGFASGSVSQTWRLDGLLKTKAWPSSDTATLAYDAAKRPTTLSFGVAGWLSQGYDRDGNVTSEARSLTSVSGLAGSGTQSFSYGEADHEEAVLCLINENSAPTHWMCSEPHFVMGGVNMSRFHRFAAGVAVARWIHLRTLEHARLDPECGVPATHCSLALPVGAVSFR